MSDSTNLGQQRRVELPQGPISYREAGSGEPLVFVHGLLVNGDLWRKVVPGLSRDYRCITPDWPLGSHLPAMKPDADLTPAGIADIIAAFLETLDLERVTLVANDSGGAISQLVVTRHPERIGRLVLTSCDAFEVFPPTMFKPLGVVARLPGSVFVMSQSMRIRAFQQLPFAFGALTNDPIDTRVLDSYLLPARQSADVRRDLRKFLTSISSRYTLEAAPKLASFNRPVLLAWDDEDRFFKWELAQRLAKAFPNARLEKIEGSKTFIPEDQPETLAALVAAFVREPSESLSPA